MIGLNQYLFVSSLLFVIGVTGVILRRNALIVLMSLELMLNASTLALIAFSSYSQKIDGQVLVFFIIAIAAAEVAIGLALIVALFRLKQTVDLNEITALKL